MSQSAPDAMGGGEPSASQRAGACTGKSKDNARLHTESPKESASKNDIREVSRAQQCSCAFKEDRALRKTMQDKRNVSLSDWHVTIRRMRWSSKSRPA